MRAPEGNGDLMRSLVVGAGEAGTTLVRALRRTPSLGLRPVGFLDDDPAKKRAQGLAVLGPISALARVAAERSIDVVIVAIPRGLPNHKVLDLACLVLSDPEYAELRQRIQPERAGIEVRITPSI